MIYKNPLHRQGIFWSRFRDEELETFVLVMRYFTTEIKVTVSRFSDLN